MNSDALFGRDGTQAPAPSHYFPDALSHQADSVIDFADDMPGFVPVKPPGPPDPEAVQRAIDEAVAAEQARARPKPRPRQRHPAQPRPPAYPVQQAQPWRPMPPAEPEQPAKTNSGCGVLMLFFFVILLLSGFLGVIGTLFP